MEKFARLCDESIIMLKVFGLQQTVDRGTSQASVIADFKTKHRAKRDDADGAAVPEASKNNISRRKTLYGSLPDILSYERN